MLVKVIWVKMYHVILVLHEQIFFPPTLSVSKAKIAQLGGSTKPFRPFHPFRWKLLSRNVSCRMVMCGGPVSPRMSVRSSMFRYCTRLVALFNWTMFRYHPKCRWNIPATGAFSTSFSSWFPVFYREDWVVATQIFLEFSPRKLGKVPILTSIFFKGVGSTTN